MNCIIKSIVCISLVVIIGILLHIDNTISFSKADIIMARNQDVVEKLIMCESSDRDVTSPHDGGSPSYSYLQFKKATWDSYVEKYGLFQGADEADMTNLIHDRWASRLVASLILEEKDGIYNWKNCGIKLKLIK